MILNNWISTCKKKTHQPYTQTLTSFIKMNWNWVIDRNIKHNTRAISWFSKNTCLPLSLTTRVIPGTHGEKRTNSYKLSSDLQMYTVSHSSHHNKHMQLKQDQLLGGTNIKWSCVCWHLRIEPRTLYMPGQYSNHWATSPVVILFF